MRRRLGYICVCNAVVVDRVKQAIIDGACTVKEVTEACGAGGGCGTCHATIKEMISETPPHVHRWEKLGSKYLTRYGCKCGATRIGVGI